MKSIVFSFRGMRGFLPQAVLRNCKESASGQTGPSAAKRQLLLSPRKRKSKPSSSSLAIETSPTTAPVYVRSVGFLLVQEIAHYFCGRICR